jgi:hypothetical protein
MNYTNTVKTLLTDGSCQEMSEWSDYLKLGLTHDHTPELIRMVTDGELLWDDQGRRNDAHGLLSPIYECFTEGFDTANLKEAKALLDGLC